MARKHGKKQKGGTMVNGRGAGVEPLDTKPAAPLPTISGPAMPTQAPQAPTPPASTMPAQKGGKLGVLSPGEYDSTGGYADSQYYTISGGRRRRSRGRKQGRSRKSKRGGSVLVEAAVPFGLLALQRYFKGSRTSKRGVRNLGKSFKRTFRRRR